jgi:hypothetical protein
MPAFECVLYQFGHHELRAPMFVSADHAALEQTAWAKHFLHVRRRLFVGCFAFQVGMSRPVHWNFIVGVSESPLVRKLLPFYGRTVNAHGSRVAFPQSRFPFYFREG